jgi:hypothetical protein
MCLIALLVTKHGLFFKERQNNRHFAMFRLIFIITSQIKLEFLKWPNVTSSCKLKPLVYAHICMWDFNIWCWFSLTNCITLQNGIINIIICVFFNAILNSNYQFYFFIKFSIYVWRRVKWNLQGCARYNYLFYMKNYYNMSSLFIWYKVSTKKIQVVILIETCIQIVIGW